MNPVGQVLQPETHHTDGPKAGEQLSEPSSQERYHPGLQLPVSSTQETRTKAQPEPLLMQSPYPLVEAALLETGSTAVAAWGKALLGCALPM